MENIFLKRYLTKNLVDLYTTGNSSAVYCEINNFVRSNIILNKLENVGSDIDAMIDRDNNIHIVYQHQNKSIMYELLSETENIKTELLKAHSNTSVMAQDFRIFKNDKHLGLFYIIKSENKYLLCCQFISDSTLPKVISVLDKNFLKFIPLSDSFGNLYIIYCDELSSQIGYKAFKWSKKEWLEFKSLNLRDNVNMLSAFIDEKNIIHLCYKSGEGLYYKNAEMTFEDFKWREEKYLTRQHINLSLCPIINEVDSVIFISWVTLDKIIAVMSADRGETWSKLREIGVAHRNEIRKIRISVPLNSINSEFYGYIINNKFNVPMLERYIDNEFKNENDFNNNFIGKVHNEGYEVEQMANRYLKKTNTEQPVSLNSKTVGLTKAEIEQIKAEISEKIKVDNFNATASIPFDFENTEKIISVKGEYPLNDENIKSKNIDKEFTNESADNEIHNNTNYDNFKNPLENIYQELRLLNVSLNKIINLEINRHSVHQNRKRNNRKKANLCKMHIKKI